MATAPQDILLTFDLRLYQGNANIGLLHCNNLKSGIVYGAMVHNMKLIAHKYYQGNELCVVFVVCCVLRVVFVVYVVCVSVV